jgi:D-alanyl-D-alanine carboxypeptidase
MRRVRWLAALCAAAFIAAALVAVPAGAQQLPSPKADILVDAGSGRVLICDNIHAPLLPASTIKIMTALAGIERIPPSGLVTADARAAGVESSKIGFAAGTRWPLEQMIAALMMVSANDAAYSIAHTVGGNLEGFAPILSATARRYGMRDSTLGDPAGLDDATAYKGGPLTSAYDLAIATRNALQVPMIAKYAGTYQYHFTDPQHREHWLTNHNRMLSGGNDGFDYRGATGFKTGFTSRAQHSLITTATRDGRTLIAVILGAPDAGYANAAALLDAGFAMGPEPHCGGTRLPAVAVSPYANRVADRDGFARLANVDASAADTAIVPASIPVGATAPHGAPKTTTIAVHHAGSSTLSSRNLFLLMLAALTAVFFLRRRAVKRRRARRIARQRQRAAAMRSGGLTVVDGRYRPGLRVGPPLDSHVHVRRG